MVICCAVEKHLDLRLGHAIKGQFESILKTLSMKVEKFLQNVLHKNLILFNTNNFMSEIFESLTNSLLRKTFSALLTQKS